mmetsp:Transcript_10485/g.33523  ORF Transcript_10485/g.33523 Transcript_10485/m.33523 type:complete len:211 (+) Transcript_10485:204-836(+)|eukprot:CAMPEP_0202077574 /NCGR_PEP_ID=MMETSP0964-20121228/5454_1 /ASSEMBLY_ACC=CAM_ASM_000500 /TAXON_ID=4773 /ORGANISM="Schizochytrium aggregatum, Strain ATCC28209" /LENGTH=210 /DNA_ID=CAMNT_0048644855 /DNA_START=183 /DNA_END=815 /DNA_ORIENTATION=+
MSALLAVARALSAWARSWSASAAAALLAPPLRDMPPAPRLVVVGLGNWGSIATRHSVGAAVVRHLAARRGLVWHRDKLAQVASDGQVVLVEPRLFMNESGRCIRPLLKSTGAKPANLLVVHDDLERALGKLSMKTGGSANGHNGLRSIISMIGQDFDRLRVGIGRPADRNQVANYVLQEFSPSEREALERASADAVDMIERIVADQGARS